MVPDLRGMNVPDAAARLGTIGLSLGAAQRGDPGGHIDRQSPAAGTRLPAGGRVNIQLASVSSPAPRLTLAGLDKVAVVLVFLVAVALSAVTNRRRRRRAAADQPVVHPTTPATADAPRSQGRTVGRLTIEPHADSRAEVRIIKRGRHQPPSLVLVPRPDHTVDAVLTRVSR
jgi:hypothetical protein